MSTFPFVRIFSYNKPFFLSFIWNANLCFTNCRCLPPTAHSPPVFFHMNNCGNNLMFTERKRLILLEKKNCAAVCKVFLIFTHIFTAIAARVLPEQERILSHTLAWMSLKRGLIQVFCHSKMGYLSPHS